MKKIIIMVCCISITVAGFSQIKTTSQLSKSSALPEPSMAMASVSIAADSLVLIKLHEEYKAADAIANQALSKVIAKLNEMKKNGGTNSGGEMNMVKLQSSMSEREKMLQLLDKMMKQMQDNNNAIAENIK